METRKKFLLFGCWNNTNTNKKGEMLGNMKQVMSKLNLYIKDPVTKPQFIVVAGDNYYSEKTATISNTGEKQETKIIHTQKLIDGLESLPNNIEINMILGNHDLETNGKKTTIFVDNINTPEENPCYTLRTVMQHKNNIDLFLFKAEMLTNDTLLLMIDTSMYREKVAEYLPCYSIFLDTKIDSGEELIDYQNNLIQTAIKENQSIKPIKNIIIVGHHPIIGIKFTTLNNSDGEIEILDDIPYFLETLQMIKRTVTNNEAKYYYLCADVHLYQSGTIDINNGEMVINQYIVGTGGTELNEKIPDEFLRETYERVRDNAKYTITESIHDFGFLECVIDETPKFTFISATNTVPAGGRKKRKTRKITKRSKKARRKTTKRNVRRKKIETNMDK